jgi:protein PhnA
MAKGFDKHQARVQALSLFGKDLARRSKSQCELSGQAGVALKIYEIAPVPSEPEFERCLFLSDSTIEQLENPRKCLKPDQWRHLNELIWTDSPQVRLMVVRILQYIAKEDPWAQEILDDAYLEEELIAEALEMPLG